jgi:two-component system, OmpR family, response regulator MprA
VSIAPEQQSRVLVVDDDRAVRESLRRSLEFNGYSVSLASDGAEALASIAGNIPDALVIDVMMPRLDGIETTRALRTAGNDLPILVLTARDSVGDRVEGLDAGAEDYLGKPFDLDELLARLRALLRRHETRSQSLPVPGGRLSTPTRSVVLGDGTEVGLTDREAALLELLARNPSRIFSRVELLDMVFDGSGEDNLVDTYVHYLRRKLGRGVVVTVRGVGYRAGR